MYKPIFLLTIIVMSLAPVVGTSIYPPVPDNEFPITLPFPWNKTIYFYTKLLGQGGFMNITDITHISLGSEFNNDLNATFEALFNETMVFLELNVNGTVEYMNDTYDFTGIDVSGNISGSINGSFEKINGNLDIRGEIRLGTDDGDFEATFYLPIVFDARYDEDTEIYTVSMGTSNGYITILGERVDIAFYRIQDFDMKNNETRTRIGFNAICGNQYVLMMVAGMLSQYLGTDIKPPVFDPATGMFKISHYEDDTVKYVFPRELREFLMYNITSVRGEINLSYSIKGDGPKISASINGYGYLRIEGDFSEGFSLDYEGYTKAKSGRITGAIRANETEVEMVLTLYVEYSTINPYLVQFTYRNIMPIILMTTTDDQSRAVIEASDGVKLYLNGQIYDKLVFTKENATLAKDLRIVVSGTILESSSSRDKILSYRVVEKSDEAHVYIFHDDTETVIVEAPFSRTIIVSALDTTLDGKAVKAVFGENKEVIIVFPETGKETKGEVRIKSMSTPPKPLPPDTVNVSIVYDVSLNTIEQTQVKISLKYDPSKAPPGSKIYVAHYINGKWELLTPDAVDPQKGYANITLTTLSPLVVVASTPATTTTPTETTTTTTITETTTTTTTTTTTFPSTTTSPMDTATTTVTETTTTTTTTIPPAPTTATTIPTSTTTKPTTKTTITTTTPTTSRTTETSSTTQIPATTTTTEQGTPITIIASIIAVIIIIVGGTVFLLKRK